MRFIVMVKANKDSEKGVMPNRKNLTEMINFNKQLVDAGVMLAGEGLHPSSEGFRVKFIDGKANLTEGPFSVPEQLVAGFWIWKVKSKNEAIEWAKRCPMSGGAEIELRQILEAKDFGTALTPELRRQEAELRAKAGQIAKQKPTKLVA